jgi:hypothetical protein
VAMKWKSAENTRFGRGLHNHRLLDPGLTGLKIQVITSEVSRQCTVKPGK